MEYENFEIGIQTADLLEKSTPPLPSPDMSASSFAFSTITRMIVDPRATEKLKNLKALSSTPIWLPWCMHKWEQLAHFTQQQASVKAHCFYQVHWFQAFLSLSNFTGIFSKKVLEVRAFCWMGTGDCVERRNPSQLKLVTCDWFSKISKIDIVCCTPTKSWLVQLLKSSLASCHINFFLLLKLCMPMQGVKLIKFCCTTFFPASFTSSMKENCDVM